MDKSMLNLIEVVFNISYLLTIWLLVFLMYMKKENLAEHDRKVGVLFLYAFLLLAIGDAGHVGFRVVAIFSGGLEANPALVGLGALATAITVTFFYMIIAEVWRVRFQKQRGIVWWSLIIIGVIRLLIMIPSANQWASVVPPYDWSLVRNIPLIIQGIAIAVLLFWNAKKTGDSMVIKVCYMIFISYACYLPVIFFVQKVPMIGMLMIPKTLAYIAIAFIAYGMFRKQTSINGL